MITVKRETTIAGLSELRNKSEAILKELKSHHVILEKHHKPVAVMIYYPQYAMEEELLDLAEDYILGALAAKRDQGSKPKDFVDMDRW